MKSLALLLSIAGAAGAAEPPPLVPAYDSVLLQPAHAAAVRELERQAALGVGLTPPPAIADEPPPPAPPASAPTNREMGIGVPKGVFRARKRIEAIQRMDAYAEEAQARNQEAGERLTQHYNEMVQRCGEPLPQWPRLGMGVAQMNCTVSMRFADVSQQLLLEQGGHRYQLIVMRSSPLRRVWMLDLRVVRIDGLRAAP